MGCRQFKRAYLIQVGHRFDSLSALQLQRDGFRLVPYTVHRVADHLANSHTFRADSPCLGSESDKVLRYPLASRVAHRLCVCRIGRNGLGIDGAVMCGDSRDAMNSIAVRQETQANGAYSR